jgi:hypothetical protein|tara:strand:+ start:997 stop:3249 length:2253 start_codon:yes stop_codon:yes gene_type:complete
VITTTFVLGLLSKVKAWLNGAVKTKYKGKTHEIVFYEFGPVQEQKFSYIKLGRRRESYVMADSFIPTCDFATLCSISLRKANAALSHCYQGKTWRGHSLIVRRVRGRGGNGGWCYEVRLDSLPAELQLQYVPLTPFETGFKSPSKGSSNWRYAITEEALKCPPGSRERAAAIKAAAAKSHFKPDGSRKQLSERTLRSWIKEYESKGYEGLSRASRADRNQRKVLITRQWDRAIKLPDDIKEQVAGKIERYIRSLWAGLQPGSGWKEVQREASRKLLRLTLDANPDMPEGKIRNHCQISRPAIERWRQYSAIAVHDMDAKAYFDKQPRIQRGIITLLPMQVVLGDVHPIDILYQRDDGSVATAKGIFWMDVATGRITGTVEFFPKGKGVRQEHVIESFAQMARDPRWGVPGELYLDNGGEYNWSKVVEDALKLTSVPIWWADNGKFTQVSDQAVTKAQPYNAPAKGQLEGAFGIIEQKHFSKIPGWIGGDRMRKKTANVGKAPVPFQGNRQELIKLIEHAVAVYNDTPQGGRLKGLSPNQRFTELVNAGWQSTRFADGVLESIFCKTERRKIHQGRIKYKGEPYYHDALTNPALGENVEIRIPLFGHQKRIAVFDLHGNFVCIALPDHSYDHGDRSGAIESGRRKTAMRKQIRQMRRNIDKLNTAEILREQAESIDPTPLPELGGVIKLSDQDEYAGRELAKPLSAIEQEKKDEEEEYFRIYDRLMSNKGPSVAADDPLEPELRQISLNQK